MRIGWLCRDGACAPGVVDGDVAHLIAPWSVDPAGSTLIEVQRLSPSAIRRRVDALKERVALADIEIKAPCAPTSKLICLGMNYRSHVDEVGSDMPAEPGLFTRFSDSLVGDGAAVICPYVSLQYDYEGEIAVMIGKAGRHISLEQALEHVFGYTIMLDGSVRDYQKHSLSAGKNFWRTGALGPWIVTQDEITGPAEMRLETRLNGQVVQSGSADCLIYDIPTAISYISRWTPLSPGDVIATGTPAGVGASRIPPVWMKAGDVVEVEVSGIGTLRNPVVGEQDL